MRFEVIVEVEESKRGWLSRALNPVKDMEIKDGKWVIKTEKLAQVEREGITRLNKILTSEGLIVHQIKRVD